MIASARPVGSVLRSLDLYHTAGASQIERITNTATVFKLTGGDGVKRVLVQMPGTIGDCAGRFEWIVNCDGNLSHQFFVPEGTINGIPTRQ